MAKPHKNDISIGKDQWITWVDLDGRQREAVDIDYFIDPMKDFWTRLETHCVAGCCGIDAFSLWPDDIKKVGEQLGNLALLQKFLYLRERIFSSEEDVFVSQRLNNYFDRGVLLQLIDHVVRTCRSLGALGVVEEQHRWFNFQTQIPKSFLLTYNARESLTVRKS